MASPPAHHADMDNRHPATYPKRILLVVTGLSPQVVTETLHALAVGQDVPFVPTEMHIITTVQGAENARNSLLSEKPGWFHRLRKDYDLPEIAFDNEHIHIVRDAAGNRLSDIRSPADNLECADFIVAKVRKLTEETDCALHVSIAGGRKTMGFFLGYSLTLYGRPQDRLSHVLVSEPFENIWEFFYPTPYENIIKPKDKPPVDTRDAKLSLAEIPFVSLRHGLPTALLDGSASYKQTVSTTQAALRPVRLEIDLDTRTVCAAGISFKLPAADLALLVVFARRALADLPALPAPHKTIADPDWSERYLKEMRAISGPLADLDKTEKRLRHGMDGEYFSIRLSTLHQKMKKALNAAARPYLIDDGRMRPRRYRLALSPDAVSLVRGKQHVIEAGPMTGLLGLPHQHL